MAMISATINRLAVLPEELLGAVVAGLSCHALARLALADANACLCIRHHLHTLPAANELCTLSEDAKHLMIATTLRLTPAACAEWLATLASERAESTIVGSCRPCIPPALLGHVATKILLRRQWTPSLLTKLAPALGRHALAPLLYWASSVHLARAQHGLAEQLLHAWADEWWEEGFKAFKQNRVLSLRVPSETQLQSCHLTCSGQDIVCISCKRD